MKSHAVLYAFLGSLLLPQAAGAADCAGVFLFLPNDRLSIQEVASLTDPDSEDAPQATPNGYEFILVMQPTDWEEAPARGKWDLLGVVYGAETGLQDKVTGGTLWVKDREAFGTGGGGTFRKTEGGVYLTVRPVTRIKGCRAGYTFKLDARGVLYANGARIGQAKPAE